jgi:RNA polymerase sigma factor (sigma-70 family)
MTDPHDAPTDIDRALVRRFQAGDRRAFVELMERHERRVYNLAYRMLGRAEDARDATQDAFLSCYRNLERFRGDSAFGTWLYRIAANACYDALRKRRWQSRSMPCRRSPPPRITPTALRQRPTCTGRSRPCRPSSGRSSSCSSCRTSPWTTSRRLWRSRWGPSSPACTEVGRPWDGPCRRPPGPRPLVPAPHAGPPFRGTPAHTHPVEPLESMTDDPQNTAHPFDALASLVDGSADPTERTAAEAHLQTCDRCRRDVALATSGRSALRLLPRSTPRGSPPRWWPPRNSTSNPRTPELPPARRTVRAAPTGPSAARAGGRRCGAPGSRPLRSWPRCSSTWAWSRAGARAVRAQRRPRRARPMSPVEGAWRSTPRRWTASRPPWPVDGRWPRPPRPPRQGPSGRRSPARGGDRGGVRPIGRLGGPRRHRDGGPVGDVPGDGLPTSGRSSPAIRSR